MLRTALICSAATAAPLLCVHAQTVPAQVEVARQFQNLPGTVDLQGQRNAPDVSRFDDTAVGDDSFGEQVILKREEKPQPFRAYAEIAAF